MRYSFQLDKHRLIFEEIPEDGNLKESLKIINGNIQRITEIPDDIKFKIGLGNYLSMLKQHKEIKAIYLKGMGY